MMGKYSGFSFQFPKEYDNYFTHSAYLSVLRRNLPNMDLKSRTSNEVTNVPFFTAVQIAFPFGNRCLLLYVFTLSSICEESTALDCHVKSIYTLFYLKPINFSAHGKEFMQTYLFHISNICVVMTRFNLELNQDYGFVMSIEQKLGKIHPIQSEYVLFYYGSNTTLEKQLSIQYSQNTKSNVLSDVVKVFNFDSNCKLESETEINLKNDDYSVMHFSLTENEKGKIETWINSNLTSNEEFGSETVFVALEL